MAVTSSGDILVCDSNTQCVQVFSSSGQFVTRWGVRGRSPGQLQRPTGVTVLRDGRVAVSDYDNKWISIHEPGIIIIRTYNHNHILSDILGVTNFFI